jgi:hypothetical protein
MPRQRRSLQSRQRSFSQKFWVDKRGNFVVWQKPNMFLGFWFIVTIINLFIPAGWVHTAVGTVSLLSLIIWAVWEVTAGVNYFRRTIGSLVLLLIVFAHLPV